MKGRGLFVPSLLGKAEMLKKTRIAWNKGNVGGHLTEEHKRKIADGNKGKVISLETKLKMRKARLGKHQTEEAKRKIGIASIGRTAWNKGMKGIHLSPETEFKKGCVSLMKGKHPTVETRKKIGEGNRGKCLSEKTKKKMSERQKGDKSHFWKGGITPLSKAIRGLFEYNQWRSDVFQRDNWTCQTCGEKGCYLEAHHSVKSFSELLQEFLQTYDQFSPFEDQHTLLRLAMKYEPFWEVDNGVTLCVKCHNLTKRGKKNVDSLYRKTKIHSK